MSNPIKAAAAAVKKAINASPEYLSAAKTGKKLSTADANKLANMAQTLKQQRDAQKASAAPPQATGGFSRLFSNANKQLSQQLAQNPALKQQIEAAQPRSFADFNSAQELYDYRLKNTKENADGNAVSKAIQADLDAYRKNSGWYNTAAEMEQINAQYSPAEAVYSPEQIAAARLTEQYGDRYAKDLEALYTQRIGEEDRIRRDKKIQEYENVRSGADFAENVAKGRAVPVQDWNAVLNKHLSALVGRERETPQFAKSQAAEEFTDSLANPAEWAAQHADQLLEVDIKGDTLEPYGLTEPLYLYMTPEQRDVYSYYVSTGGRKKADEYFESIKQDLRVIRNNARSEYQLQWAEDNPILAFIARPFNQLGTLANIPETIKQEFQNSEWFGDGIDRPLDTSVGAFDASRRSEAYAQGITNTVDSEFGKFMLNVGFSLSDNAVAAGAGVILGPWASAALLSAESGSAALYEAGERGLSPSEASKVAVITGGWEYLTEKIAFDELFDTIKAAPKSMTAQKLQNILKQSGVEASEEYANSLLSTMTERLVMGGNSSYDQYVRDLQAQGATYEEAVEAANLQFYWLQPLESAASGFMSGGIMSTSGTVISDIANYGQPFKTPEQQTAASTLAGITQREQSGSSTVADTVAEKVLTGQTPSNSEIRQLQNATTTIQRAFEGMTGIEVVGVDSSNLRAAVAAAVKNPVLTADMATQVRQGVEQMTTPGVQNTTLPQAAPQYNALNYNAPDASAIGTIDAARQGGAPLDVATAQDAGSAANIAQDFRERQVERRDRQPDSNSELEAVQAEWEGFIKEKIAHPEQTKADAQRVIDIYKQAFDLGAEDVLTGIERYTKSDRSPSSLNKNLDAYAQGMVDNLEKAIEKIGAPIDLDTSDLEKATAEYAGSSWKSAAIYESAQTAMTRKAATALLDKIQGDTQAFRNIERLADAANMTVPGYIYNNLHDAAIGANPESVDSFVTAVRAAVKTSESRTDNRNPTEDADIRFRAARDSEVDSSGNEGYNQNEIDNGGNSYGAEQRYFEESAERFRERARKENLRVVEDDTAEIRYAFREVRRDGHHGTSLLLSKKAERVERKLTEYGIKHILYSGELWVNDGRRTGVPEGDSFTIGHRIVAINITESTREDEYVGHEALHLWYGEDGTAEYSELVLNSLLLGDEFYELHGHINRTVFDGRYDIADEKQRRRMNEELVAYVSGMIHSGQDVTALLENPDEVIAVWNKLVEEHTVEGDGDDPLFRLTGNQYDAIALYDALEADALSNAKLANLTAQLRDKLGDGYPLSNNPTNDELLEAVSALEEMVPDFILNITEKQYKTAAQKTAEKAAREKAADRTERKRLADEEKQRKAAEAEQKKAAIVERRAKAEKTTKKNTKKSAKNAAPKAPRQKSITSLAAEHKTGTAKVSGYNVNLTDPEAIALGLEGDAHAEFVHQMESVNEFGKAFGHSVNYYYGRASDADSGSAGFYYNGKIYVNVNSLRAAGLKAVAHEICHDIAAKEPSFVNSFYRLYREYCESNGMMNEFNRRWNEIYNNSIYPNKQLAIAEEVLAEMFGEYASGDSEFLNYCLGKRPGIITRIVEAFNRILTRLHLKKFSKAAADAMKLRNFLLGTAARYQMSQTGRDMKLSAGIRSDYRSAQRKAEAIGNSYVVFGDRGVNLAEWDTTGLASPKEYKNLNKKAPNEVTNYGFKQVIVNGKLRDVLIVNPTRYVTEGVHADVIASSRSLAAALGLRLGFISGDTSEVVGKGKNRREQVIDADFLLADGGSTLFINLNSEIPYTKIVAGAWWSKFRKSNPAAAAHLERLAERSRKLSGDDKIVQDYAVGMLTRANAQGLKALNLNPETLVEKLSDSKSAAYAFAHESPGIIRKLFENAGDMVAKLTKKQDYRAAYISGQLQARLMKAFSETSPNRPGGDKIETVKRKTAPEGVWFMYAGENAQTANRSMLKQAQDMIDAGVEPETVRQETGWFKGMDGRWRFEIDDSTAQYHRAGDARFSRMHADYARHQTLLNKMLNGQISPEEHAELRELDEIWGRERGRLNERVDRGKATLDEILDHEALFEAYPELRNVKVRFEVMYDGERGKYDRKTNTITLHSDLRDAPEDTLLHEIQHAVQSIEGFSGGASPIYWAAQMSHEEVTEQLDRERREILSSLGRSDANKYARFEDLDLAMESMLKSEDFENNAELQERYVRLEAESDKLYRELHPHDWFRRLQDIRRQSDNPSEIYRNMYHNTAGEIEARDTAARRSLTSEQRKNTRPDIDREDVVFADHDSVSLMSSEEAASIKQQIQQHLVEINNLAPVADINSAVRGNMNTTQQVRKIADYITSRFGKSVSRKGYGEILMGIEQIKDGIRYVNTDAEYAAFFAVPYVLKRGIAISGHQDHKGRGYSTITFAAPVKINGDIGNLAVVVKQSGKSKYKMHRILMPDGTGFKLNKKYTEPTTYNIDAEYSIEGKSIGSVYEPNIPHPADEVKFSARRDNNAVLREPTRTERRAWLDDYADTYGQIPEGEDVNSRGDQRIPRRIDSETKTRQTYRTYAEALTTPDDFVGELEREIIDGRASYTPLSNKAAAGYAERKLAEGMDEAMATWNAVTHGDVIADKNQIALGERLIMEAINNRDVKLFTKLVSEVAAEATRAGQMVQAISMVKRLSPEGQLVSFQKEVSKLNESLANRKGHPQITPDETLTQEYMDIASELESVRQEISDLERTPEDRRSERQQDAIDSLETQEKKLEQQLKDKKNEMITDAAEQVPSTWMDKLRAWRYLAMLGNPRTHIRNLLGNAVFIPAVRIKQGIAGGIERMTRIKPGERTQGIRAGKELRDFAREDAKTQLDILASGGKYNQTDAITAEQKPFDDSKVIGKTLNKLADINSAALEGEDAFFLRRHYEFALSRFAAANKWTVEYLKRSPEALAKARGFAYREAQRATYRDMSSFAQLMSKVSNKLSKARGFGKLGYMMFEGAMPFKKTPCNIMKRGIEYSPLGIATAISKGAIMLRDRHNGVQSDYSGTEFINDLAAGMTGTMIMGLGYLLTSLGMLHGRDKDEEDEINAIQGVQEYSVIIGGYSYTVDWVTPVAFPLFVGSELYDQISADRDGYTLDDFYDSLAGIAEPLFSLSMMDGVQSMMQSYSSEGAIFEAGMSAAESYVGQYFPTINGQLARTVTPEVHSSSYRDKTDTMPDFLSGVVQKAMAKIPGAYGELPEKIDVWGRNVGSDEPWYQRAAENFLSPGYLERIETTDADRLVQDLYRETGDAAVIPGSASKYFTVNGERYDMEPDEYVAYAKTRGKTSYGILTEFYTSDEFKQLTTEQQVSCVGTAYKFATAIAKSQTNSGYVIDVKWQREAYDAFLAGETTLAQAIIEYKTK